jgi:hypothetical protein
MASGGEAPIGGAAAMAALWGTVEIIKVFVRKWRSPRELQLDERKLLSLDEQAFRETILAELRYVRAELATCQSQHAEAVRERVTLADKLDATNRRLERVVSAALAGGVVLEPEV